MSLRYRTRTRRRILSMETLEGRWLLDAAGFIAEVPPQNFANPEDTNYDGVVSPADALIIVNDLNQANASGSTSSRSVDVDGDGVVTPRDALLVINRLNSRSSTSSVAPQQRAIGLRKALAAGYAPPNMSSIEVQELLDTLENGGRYEAGDRFRNGQMLNIDDPPADVTDTVAVAESEASTQAPNQMDPTNASLVPDSESFLSVDDDLHMLFETAGETLTDELHDTTLWNSLVASQEHETSDAVEHISTHLAETLADAADARERLEQAIADVLEDSDATVDDIATELQAFRATIGDAHSQMSQMFANADLEAIIEELGVDLGTLARAVLSHDATELSDHEEIVADLMSREYLDGF